MNGVNVILDEFVILRFLVSGMPFHSFLVELHADEDDYSFLYFKS
jgi:hypothetical protein